MVPSRPFLLAPPPADAYNMAKLLCDKYYMASPDLEIEEVNGEAGGGSPLWGQGVARILGGSFGAGEGH